MCKSQTMCWCLLMSLHWKLSNDITRPPRCLVTSLQDPETAWTMDTVHSCIPRIPSREAAREKSNNKVSKSPEKITYGRAAWIKVGIKRGEEVGEGFLLFRMPSLTHSSAYGNQKFNGAEVICFHWCFHWRVRSASAQWATVSHSLLIVETVTPSLRSPFLLGNGSLAVLFFFFQISFNFSMPGCSTFFYYSCGSEVNPIPTECSMK